MSERAYNIGCLGAETLDDLSWGARVPPFIGSAWDKAELPPGR